MPGIAASLLEMPAPLGGVPSGEDPALTMGSPSALLFEVITPPPAPDSDNGTEPAATGSLGVPTLRAFGLEVRPAPAERGLR